MRRLKIFYHLIALSGLFCSTVSWATGTETEIGSSETLKVVIYNPDIIRQEVEPFSTNSIPYHKRGLGELVKKLPIYFKTGTGWLDGGGGLNSKCMQWMAQAFQDRGFDDPERAKNLVWVYLGRHKKDPENIKWYATFSFQEPDQKSDRQGDRQWIQHTSFQAGGGALEGVVSHTPPQKSTTEEGPVWLHVEVDRLSSSTEDYQTVKETEKVHKYDQNMGKSFQVTEEVSVQRLDHDKVKAEGVQFMQMILNHLRGLEEVWVYRPGNNLDDERFVKVQRPKLWSSSDQSYLADAGFRKSVIRAATPQKKQGDHPWRLKEVLTFFPHPSYAMKTLSPFENGMQEAEIGRTETSRIVIYNPEKILKDLALRYDGYRKEYVSCSPEGLVNAAQDLATFTVNSMHFANNEYYNKDLQGNGMLWFYQEFRGSGFHDPEKAKNLVYAYLERNQETGNIQRYARFSLSSLQYVSEAEGGGATEGIFSNKSPSNITSKKHVPVWMYMTFREMGQKSESENVQFLKTILTHLETVQNKEPFYVYSFGSGAQNETFIPVTQIYSWTTPDELSLESFKALGFTKRLVRTAHPKLKEYERGHEGAVWGSEEIFTWKPKLHSAPDAG